MEPTDLTVTVAHKGFAWVTVDTYGRAAHGSRYEEGVDAIARMGKFLVAVEQLGEDYLDEAGHPLVGHRSIHASLIEGGTELSTYPDHCRARFERRTLPGENPAGIVEELEQLCAELAKQDSDFRADVELDFTRSGYELQRDAPVVEALAAAYKETAGDPPEYSGTSGWLDSALLGEAGIPTVIFGPTGTGAHAAVEYVTLDSIVTGAAVLAHMIVASCG
jgi:acetylornithine deacetylase